MQQDFAAYADEVASGLKDDRRPKLDTVSATDLQQTDLPPVIFRVHDLIPNGFNLLCSPPKFGKSWMALDISLAVSSGRPFLGFKTEKCGVLYLALEDSYHRLKSRMDKLLAGQQAPPLFDMVTSCSDLDHGLYDELEDYLAAHPSTGLVIIDTLQRIRGEAHGRDAYADDYRVAGGLKKFADAHGIALLVIHHLRKMGDPTDPFARISGTNGLLGASDTALVLSKEKRDADEATLSIVGRDVEADELVLRFNKDTCRWVNMGNAEDYAQQQALVSYQTDPIVMTVRKLLEQSPTGWSGTAQQLLDAGRFIVHKRLADTPRDLTNKLKALDDLLLQNDNIIHERTHNGSGGGKHRFRYADTFEDLPQGEIVPFE